MSLNILFYMDENPVPINNGVTVAVAGLATGLDNYCNIFIYNYTENSYYLFHNISFIEPVGQDVIPLSFDVVICSPILAIKHFVLNRSKVINYRYLVGFINDNYTYVLWRNFILSIIFKSFNYKDVVNLLKIPLVYIAETILCNFPDRVLVQTSKDKSIFNYFLIKNKNILVTPNSTQFTFEPSKLLSFNRSGVGFVASFNDTYIKVAIWFIDNVWINVIKNSPELKLHVLGKNSHRVYDYTASKYPDLKSSIVVESYYEDLSEFYSKMSTVVSPVFKNYGLINKTVEAMLCGCVVVGDKAAFNGIEKFENGRHGFVAKNAKSFSKIIQKVASQPIESNDGVRLQANELIVKSFDWNSNAHKLLASLELIKGDS